MSSELACSTVYLSAELSYFRVDQILNLVIPNIITRMGKFKELMFIPWSEASADQGRISDVRKRQKGRAEVVTGEEDGQEGRQDGGMEDVDRQL